MSETRICKCCGQEKPIEEFCKNGIGYTSVCREGSNAKKRKSWAKRKINIEEEIEKVKSMRLEDFTPRELMAQLHKLGYTGTLKYTKVEIIDLSKIA